MPRLRRGSTVVGEVMADLLPDCMPDGGESADDTADRGSSNGNVGVWEKDPDNLTRPDALGILYLPSSHPWRGSLGGEGLDYWSTSATCSIDSLLLLLRCNIDNIKGSCLQRYWFQRIPKTSVRKVHLACHVITIFSIRVYSGYLVLDDGCFVMLAPVSAWPYQLRRPNCRVMRKSREVAEWAGVPLEIFNDPHSSPKLS